MEKLKSQLLPIVCFFALAFALSWLANAFIPKLNIAGVDVQAILTGFGPALSGLICYWLFKTPNAYKISFAGTKPLVTVVMLAIALILPVLLAHKVSKTAMIAFVATQFLYCIGEELGWRHYLQNATFGLNKWVQPFVIGTVWFFWHYSILANPIKMLSGQNIPFFVGIPLLIVVLSLFSMLLGNMVNKTGAATFPILIHYATKMNNGTCQLAILIMAIALYLLWNKLPEKPQLVPA